MNIFSKSKQYVGPAQSSIDDIILPVGLSRVKTSSHLSIAYINPDGQVTDMFVLDPGQHTVRLPSARSIVVDCDKKCNWIVIRPGRFCPSDPARVSAAMVRPRTQREEMQDYLNEMLARATGGRLAQQLRSGQAEIDISQDDYEDDEDDSDSPLSVHQLEGLVSGLQADLKRKLASAKPSPAVDEPLKVDSPEFDEVSTKDDAGE